MKRSLSLFEVVIVCVLLASVAPWISHRILMWRAQYDFNQQQEIIEETLFEAQMVSILTSTTTEVVLSRDGPSWTISCALGGGRARVRKPLAAIKEVNGNEQDSVVVRFLLPFGDAVGGPILLTSSTGVEREAQVPLVAVTTKDREKVFTDTLLTAWENAV